METIAAENAARVTGKVAEAAATAGLAQAGARERGTLLGRGQMGLAPARRTGRVF